MSVRDAWAVLCGRKVAVAVEDLAAMEELAPLLVEAMEAAVEVMRAARARVGAVPR